jgi:hypothetical protein
MLWTHAYVPNAILIGAVLAFLLIVTFPVLFHSLGGEEEAATRTRGGQYALEDRLIERLRPLIVAQITSGVDVRQELETLVDGRITADFVRKIRKTLSADVIAALEMDAILSRMEETRRRFQQAISRLNAQSRFNLLLGGMLGFAGFAVLGYFLFRGISGGSDTTARVMYFGARIFLVFTIHAFAYFFLNLYKVGITEIKYFENEMTNFETKAIALIVARQIKDSPSLARILVELASTERNFVLKKGESTVTLRRDEIDHSHLEHLAGALTNVVKSKLGKEADDAKAEAAGPRS